MRRIVVAAGSLLFLAVPVAAFQEGASQTQQAEKVKPEERQKKPARPDKVFTNEDLLRRRADAVVTAEEAPAETEGEAKAEGGAPEKTEDQIRAEKAAEIQKEIDRKAERAAGIRKGMETAQLELNDLSSYTYSAGGGRRLALMRFLEDAKAELAKIDQAISELEEKARRQGLSVSRP